jgi:hypothetical protein
MGEATCMEWTGFTDGEFAKCKHGYYFIYKKFSREMGMDRWFADYERGSKHFAGDGERFTLHGLESPEEARRRCEQHANTIGLTTGL